MAWTEENARGLRLGDYRSLISPKDAIRASSSQPSGKYRELGSYGQGYSRSCGATVPKSNRFGRQKTATFGSAVSATCGQRITGVFGTPRGGTLMAKRIAAAEGMGVRAKRALAFVDRLAEKDQLTFGLLTGYALKKAADLEPESLAAILAGALVKLSELNRSAYDRLGGQIVWNTLRESGFLEVLAEVKQKATAGDAKGAVEAADRIGVWAKGIESLAAGGPVQALIDAQEAAGTKKAYVN